MEKSSFSGNVRASNIKALLDNEEQKLERQVKKHGKKRVFTQARLADQLGIEPQNLSRCMISGNISEKMCRKIIELYPDYRIEWLLGYDDCMTHYEWADRIEEMRNIAADGIWAMIERSLKKQGKSLRFVHRQGQHIDATERLHADCYYSIVDREGNELKRLTALEMVQFEEKIQEYCDFMSGKYL